MDIRAEGWGFESRLDSFKSEAKNLVTEEVRSGR